MNSYDVVIVGAGNAALSAAMAARENGASVLVLEKAHEDEKGGNSYFTAGGFRFCHDGIDDLATDVLTDLSQAERAQIVLPVHDRKVFYDALMKVTRHQSNEDMAWQLIDGSRPAMVWLRGHGIRFIPMFGRQSFLIDGKHHFYGGVNIEAVGGGAGLVEAELKRAAQLGCEIRYGTGATRLIQDRQRRQGGGAGLRRLRIKPGDAGALSRPRLGPGPGSRHPAQHGRRHPHGAGDRCRALWQLVRLPFGRLGYLGPALWRPGGAG
jgi:tricarballylate dehydrogenase